MPSPEEEWKKKEQAGYDKIAIARYLIKKKTPYFASVAYSLVPVAVKGIGTVFTTDKLVLGFDPEWLASIDDEEAAGAIWHETQHVVNEHFDRGVTLLDKALANKAMDLAINCSAKHMGYKLPDFALYPERYGFPPDLTMEEYYALLENPPSPKPPKKQKGAGGVGAGSPPPPAPGAEEHKAVCSGHCGSVAGNKDENEALTEQVNAAAEKESPGCVKTEVEIRAVLKQAAKDIVDHVAQHGRGHIPAHLIEKAKLTLRPPKVNWRTKLRKILRRGVGRVIAGGTDYSKARPSKRTYMRGIIVPGLIKRQAVVALVRDTSGSMGKPQLRDAQNEAVGVMKALGLDTAWFMDADAAAGKPRIVRVQDIPKLPITGRGGTDFGPALDAVQKLKPRPKLVLYFTDGDGDAPDVPPRGIEVIWVIVDSYYNKAPADWGHAIFVEGDKAKPVEDEDDYEEYT